MALMWSVSDPAIHKRSCRVSSTRFSPENMSGSTSVRDGAAPGLRVDAWANTWSWSDDEPPGSEYSR